jgi:hypothetical protein
MKIGDRVRIIGIPPNLPDDEKFKTPEVFQRCLGRTFAIADIQRVEGLVASYDRFWTSERFWVRSHAWKRSTSSRSTSNQ